MSAGMRIWGPTGALELDETSFTVRVIYSGLVARNSGVRNVFVSLPGVTPATHSAICLPIGAYPQDPNAQNAYAVQFEPQVVNDGVYVWFGNRNAPADAATGLSTQRLLVMRYK